MRHWPNMDPMLEHLFKGQVAEQCEFALASASEIDRALTELHQAKPQGQQVNWQRRMQAQDRLWFSIRALLTAAANISKILFPAEGRRLKQDFPDRGERLRASLGVPDDSPLANRDVRNHFEHMDERLEEWWVNDPNHNIAHRVIGPLDKSVVGLSKQQMFEQFDPATGRVAFWGDVYELRPLLDAIQELRDRALQATSKPWWTQEEAAAEGFEDDG